jgi:hypothetical protein
MQKILPLEQRPVSKGLPNPRSMGRKDLGPAKIVGSDAALARLCALLRAAEKNLATVTDKTVVIPGHGPVGRKN